MKMPKAPRFSIALLGPGIVLVAMGLGSGEYILWPHLIAQFGFGILWGALVGILLQYFISIEASRYTLASGGSVYYAFYRLNKYIPLWFIISTFTSFAWPGIIASSGLIFARLFGMEDYRLPTIGMLLLIGALLSFGGKVYNNLEKFQKVVILFAIPALLIMSLMLANVDNLSNLYLGILGIGEGYLFLPSGISMIGFLGAVAYSGAAGNLILSNSFYIQDEGLAMAQGMNTQIHHRSEHRTVPQGEIFDTSDNQNVLEFRKWYRLNAFEQFISFFIIGIFTIVILALISYSLLYPYQGSEGLTFIFRQSELLVNRFGEVVGSGFLVIGVLFLFKTQLGIYETTSRIMTENIQLFSKFIAEKYRRSNIFFSFLWLQITAAIVITLLNLEQPLVILLTGTFFSAVSMLVLSGLIFLLNKSRIIPKEIRPGCLQQGLVVLGVLFYLIFVVLTVIEIL